jgi:hypothetical protein
MVIIGAPFRTGSRDNHVPGGRLSQTDRTQQGLTVCHHQYSDSNHDRSLGRTHPEPLALPLQPVLLRATLGRRIGR